METLASSISSRTRIVATLAILGVAWLALPVSLQRASQGLSNEQCLTLADRPPDPDGPGTLAALERCSALVPDDVELMADLGRAYESLDRPAEAEATYQRALSLDADYADVRGRLATLMLMRGASDEARRHAEMALRVQPNRQALRELHEKASRAAPDQQP